MLLALVAMTGPAEAANAARGGRLVARDCGRCHATGRTGASPLPAAPLFRELGRRYPLEDLQEALAEGILTAHPAMPQFSYEPTEVNDIIAYLESVQTAGPKALEPSAGRP